MYGWWPEIRIPECSQCRHCWPGRLKWASIISQEKGAEAARLSAKPVPRDHIQGALNLDVTTVLSCDLPPPVMLLQSKGVERLLSKYTQSTSPERAQ